MQLGRHSNSNAVAFAFANPIAHADCNGDRYANPNSCSQPYSDCESDFVAQPDPSSDRYADANSCSQSYPESDCERHADPRSH